MQPGFCFHISAGNDISCGVLARYQDALHMKVPYTPPYEPFCALKELQLLQREAEKVQGSLHTVVFDLSEWLGHGEELFFHIFAMYLADHPDCACHFTAVSADREKVQPLYRTLRLYMDGSLDIDATFGDVGSLERYLVAQNCTRKAAGALASMLMRPEGRFLCSYAGTARLLDEIRRTQQIGKRRIDICHLAACGTESLLQIVMGKRLLTQTFAHNYERSEDHAI